MTPLQDLQALTGLNESACEIASEDLGWSYADLKTWWMHLGRLPTKMEVEGISMRLLGGSIDIDALAKATVEVNKRFPDGAVKPQQ